MKCPFVIKECKNCKRLLVANGMNFHKKKTGKYGLRNECKKCRSEHDKCITQQLKKENPNRLNAFEKQEICKREREGLCFITKYGESYVIMNYKNACSIYIKFRNGYEKCVAWNNIQRDAVISPYAKTVYDVGYIGVGKYDPREHLFYYQKWSSMIQRCYDPYRLNKFPTYIDCYVCNEWHCFQNFAKWCDEGNYYKCNNERMELDKDILVKGNKIYSPETCIFVPMRINVLFTKSNTKRGKYPIGVTETYNNAGSPRLFSQCSVFDKNKKRKGHVTLGVFQMNEPFRAFYAYKVFKENYIKEVADEYKHLIPKKLYKAMYEYKVEIND